MREGGAIIYYIQLYIECSLGKCSSYFEERRLFEGALTFSKDPKEGRLFKWEGRLLDNLRYLCTLS